MSEEAHRSCLERNSIWKSGNGSLEIMPTNNEYTITLQVVIDLGRFCVDLGLRLAQAGRAVSSALSTIAPSAMVIAGDRIWQSIELDGLTAGHGRRV
jgi:hypothetical protein